MRYDFFIMKKELRYKVLRPTTHEEWLDERKKGIGSSEVGAIMHLSPFTTPYKVWRAKKGLDEPTQETPAMIKGHIFEDYVAKKFEEETGATIIKNTAGDWIAVDKEYSYLRVSPDRIYYPKGAKKNESNKCILEIKSSDKPFKPECLKDECLYWYCQVEYQLHVMGLKHGMLGFINREYCTTWFEPIEYDRDFCENIMLPALHDFWRMIEEDVAPEDFNAEDTALRCPREQSGKSFVADVILMDMIAERKQLDIQSKQMKSRMDEIDDTIKMQMGDAECILSSDKKPIVMWKANKSSMKFDSKLFQQENPSQYEMYCHEVQGARVFRYK